MSERPGEQEAGYPAAPEPRPQPYTVDHDVAADPANEQGGGEQPSGEQSGGDQGSGEQPEAQAWRPGPSTPHRDVPAAPPWRVPTRDTVDDRGEPQAEQHPVWGLQRLAQPVPYRPAGSQQSAGQPSGYPQVAGSQQPAGQSGGYPPAAPPPEFVTSDAAAASSADSRYTWHSPAAQPWNAPAPGPAPRTARRRRTVGLGVVVLLVLVALLGGIVLGALGARWMQPTTNSGAPLPAPAGTTSTARPPDSVAGIAAAALESTVYIEVRGGGAASSGSGMVLREDGYIVTNNHVIAPAADGQGRVTLTFADGSQEDAEIVGRTADYDLAVLKVAVTGLTPLSLADSDAVVVGDPAVAVGAPLGLEGTVTSGIVSALNRPVEAGRGGDTTSFINAIQTDAAINPGNSGGPLLNDAGEVIGINTAIAQAAGQQQTGSIGLGFAIPANQVRRTAEQIIETGQATYPVIGVALDTRYGGEGVLVLEQDAPESPAVTPGGPGDEAGIEPGDVITHFDGQPVTTPSELIVAVRSRAPGDTVVLTVRSDGGPPREVEVVLDEAGSE